MPPLTESDRLKAEAFAITYATWQKSAPSATFLDGLERRLAMGEIRTVRQIAPGTYSWIEAGEIFSTTDRRPSRHQKD